MLPVMSALLLLGALAWSEPASPESTLSLSLTEGTWMNVDVHRRTIVFDLMGDIWRLSMTGGDAEPLTTGGAWDRQPRFSPSGRHIAYVSDHSGRDQVWIMDRTGRNPRTLTQLTDAAARDPVWTPDGTAVIIRRVEDDGRSALWRYPVARAHEPDRERVRVPVAVALTDLDRHPLAGEATASEQGIWFSVRDTPYAPDADPVAGLWQIMWQPLAGGTPRPVLAGAGSAARPTLSPDGRRLAFISRDRDKTLLEVLDLTNSERTIVADWLSRDQLEGPAGQGTYPALAWTEDSRAMVVWALGGLWSVSLSGAREPIPFQATGRWPMAAHSPPPHALPDEVTARSIGGMAWGPDGTLAFTAMGALWLRNATGERSQLAAHTGDVPAWRADGHALAWTSAPGAERGSLSVQTFGWRSKTEDLPLSGRLLSPAWSEDNRELAVLRQIDNHDGATWYEAMMLSRRLGRWSMRQITTLDGYGAEDAPPQLRLKDGRLWFPAEDPELGTVFMSVRESGADPKIHLRLPGAEEVVAAPDLSRLAYRAGRDVFVVDLPRSAEATDAETLPRMRANGGAGRGLAWLSDGGGLSWFEGDALHIRRFDAAEATVIADAAPALPRAGGEGLIALTHARVLTMAREDEVIDDATIVIEGARIVSVAAGAPPPAGAEVIDCSGMVVIPGLIDVQARAHADRGAARPAQEWRYETA
ncbi:MAG: hypothetical protein ACI8S6_005776, partial [Myxococcota bacterium]